MNLRGRVGNRLTFSASYTWSHAIDNVDPDAAKNPNDPNFTGRTENASAIFDQRHRAVFSGVVVGEWGLHYGSIVTVATGITLQLVTGTNNSGDTGATADRPVIGNVVVGRNAGRGGPITNSRHWWSGRSEFMSIFVWSHGLKYSICSTTRISLATAGRGVMVHLPGPALDSRCSG